MTPIWKATAENFQDRPSDDFNFTGTQWDALSSQVSQDRTAVSRANVVAKGFPTALRKAWHQEQLSMGGFASSRKGDQEPGAHTDAREGS